MIDPLLQPCLLKLQSADYDIAIESPPALLRRPKIKQADLATKISPAGAVGLNWAHFRLSNKLTVGSIMRYWPKVRATA